MKEIKLEELDRLILSTTMWENKKEFFENKEKMPQPLADMIFAKHSEYKKQLHALLVGFDENKKARIFIIANNNFTIEDVTELNHYSIGSGTPFSMIFFDQEEYRISFPLQDGLYFAYRAKKAAESHIGVGKMTDIIILRKDKTPVCIKANDDEMKKLNEIYKNERKSLKEVRNKTLTEIELKIIEKKCQLNKI
ncbi:MAG: hypothetical protein ACFFDH_03300 [Promethearchaeota archaeon]